MAQAKTGDTVRVHFTGRLDDGTIFGSSVGLEPLEFTIGKGEIIEGFEAGVVGVSPGEKKTVTVAPEAAYGPHRDEMVIQISRADFPPDLEPVVGQQLQMQHSDGGSVVVVVTDVSESTVTLDGNHPLAGRELTFEIELLEILPQQPAQA